MTNTTTPWLVFPTGKSGNQLTFNNVSDLKREKKGYTKRFQEIGEYQCLTSAHGWIVMEHLSSDKLVLWNPTTREFVELPPRHPNDIDEIFSSTGCFVSAPPTSPDCMVLFWGKDFFLFWRLGDETWTKQPYVLIKNGCQINDFIYRVTMSSDGCIYALTTMETLFAVIDREACGVLSVRLLNAEKPQGYCERQCSSMFMVEFCKEIYYVCLDLEAGDTRVIKGIEVFKMDPSKEVWVKVEHLGDLTICLSYKNSAVFQATDSKLKGNHIYVSLYQDMNILYVYSLEDDSLTVYELNLPKPFFKPFWLIPSDKVEVVTTEKRKVESNACNRIKLPMDILHSIAMRLPLPVDCVNFRLACKTFANSVPKIQWRIDPLGSTIQYPWLMHSKRGKSGCSFLDPMCNVTHCFDIPGLLGSKIWFSKDGWLLMARSRSMFLLNPFTKATIQLPDLNGDFAFRGLSFSAPPTSSECIVFGICNPIYDRVVVCYVRLGEEAWTCIEHENQGVKFNLSDCNPVFHNGMFYCLGRECHMGIFHLKDDRTGDWKVHLLPSPRASVHQNYLVESNGELLSVFVGSKGSWVCAYKLISTYFSGDLTMQWRSLKSLGDQMVFVSRSTSLSLKAANDGMRNKIYFPLLFDNKKNNYLFYSLETCMWESSFGDCLKNDIYSSTELLHCTWIQPTLRWKSDLV
ncbi:hypothetical protein ACHQM5_014887 [Ranunculus cassubicifolius]